MMIWPLERFFYLSKRVEWKVLDIITHIHKYDKHMYGRSSYLYGDYATYFTLHNITQNVPPQNNRFFFSLPDMT